MQFPVQRWESWSSHHQISIIDGYSTSREEPGWGHTSISRSNRAECLAAFWLWLFVQQSVNSNQVSCIKRRFPHIAGIQPMQRGDACWVKSANKMEKKKKKMLTMFNTERCLDFFSSVCLSDRLHYNSQAPLMVNTMLSIYPPWVNLAGSPQWREPRCHCIHISPPHSGKTHCCTTAVEEAHARCDSCLMQKDTRWQKGQETEVGYKHAPFQTAQTNTSKKSAAEK